MKMKMGIRQSGLPTIEKEIDGEHTINIGENKLKIKIDNNEEILFNLNIGLSYYKYIKRLKYSEIIKELNIYEYNNIEDVFNYLKNSEYLMVNKEGTKGIIIDKREIIFEEKCLTEKELIVMLINEVKEIKDNYKKQNEKINKLMIYNNKRVNQTNILEKQYKELKEYANKLDENKKEKYKNIINLIYETKEEGDCNIFGKKFVEINKDNIELNINGKKSILISHYR
jgi:hypothetical protein